MARTLLVLVPLLAVASTATFFDYKTDCRIECQLEDLPCTISELSPQHFPCTCIDTDDACVELATAEVVCLMPDSQPVGGSSIWIPYWNYTHPLPPEPSPKPSPQNETNYLQIYAAVVTTVLFITVGSSLIRCVCHTWRRRHYQQLSANTAPSTGISAPDSPYRATTQEL